MLRYWPGQLRTSRPGQQGDQRVPSVCLLASSGFFEMMKRDETTVLFSVNNLSKLARNIQTLDTWCDAKCTAFHTFAKPSLPRRRHVHNSPASSQGSPPSSTKKSSTNWRLGDKYAHTNTKNCGNRKQDTITHKTLAIDRLAPRYWTPATQLPTTTSSTKFNQVQPRLLISKEIHTCDTHLRYTLQVHTWRNKSQGLNATAYRTSTLAPNSADTSSATPTKSQQQTIINAEWHANIENHYSCRVY